MTKMNKAVAFAVLAMGASAAQAGITIPAGDWTIDIGGNVNAYATTTSCDNNATAVAGGLACNVDKSNTTLANTGTDDRKTNISTGLLPNFLSVSGKTRQNDIDIGFTISIQPGNHSNAALSGGAGQENRQAFMTFGDKSWGTVKAGMDLGIFGSDAILNDMTLLGVGAGGGNNHGQATTTLGRIGTGFMYADWLGQISYASPNWNGFSFNVGVMEPLLLQASAGGGTGASHAAQNTHAQPGYQGKVSYEWGGDVSGKVWLGGMYQKVEGIVTAIGVDRDDSAQAWELGGKVHVGFADLVAYYYDGEGIGATGLLVNGFAANGKSRDSSGGYVQAMFTLPTATKVGISWGESNLDRASGEAKLGNTMLSKNEMWTLGVYHPLTKSLNLVAEYSDVQSEAQDSHVATGGAKDADSQSVSIGAILFF